VSGAVLVTGAQGFIGSWLAERLLDGGERVIVPLRPVAGDSRFRRDGIEARCEQVAVDLLDVPSVSRVLNEHGVETVFHLAARTAAGQANHSPLVAYEANVRGTYAVLEACRAVRADGLDVRVVATSSYHAYGRHEGDPYTEGLGLRPRYPYEVSKACADMIARCYADTFGLPAAVVRLGNVYGGGDLEFSRMVPDAARALVGGSRPVIRSDGTPERDFVYVEDVVDACLAVAGSLDRSELGGRAWNVGADEPVAVADLVRTLVRVSGRDLEPEILGEADPRAEIDRQHLDSSAIRGELGWRPAFGLDDGLERTYAWYRRELG
jgi:CDP-glucose 4,6-dehydratase